jgi:hypothetical protein
MKKYTLKQITMMALLSCGSFVSSSFGEEEKELEHFEEDLDWNLIYQDPFPKHKRDDEVWEYTHYSEIL